MSPADLPWWGWMLCAAGAALLARVSFTNAWSSLLVSQNIQTSQRSYFVGVVVSIAAAILGIVGLVRFVKWIWES
jgi:hypothetical protein